MCARGRPTTHHNIRTLAAFLRATQGEFRCTGIVPGPSDYIGFQRTLILSCAPSTIMSLSKSVAQNTRNNDIHSVMMTVIILLVWPGAWPSKGKAHESVRVKETGRVNANLCVYCAKKCCTQSHWKRCVRCTQKRGLSFNTSQTTHEANDHEWYASILKEKRASFVKNILFRSVVSRTRLVKEYFEVRHSCLFFFIGGFPNCGTQNYLQFVYAVHKVCVSPQKLQRDPRCQENSELLIPAVHSPYGVHQTMWRIDTSVSSIWMRPNFPYRTLPICGRIEEWKALARWRCVC